MEVIDFQTLGSTQTILIRWITCSGVENVGSNPTYPTMKRQYSENEKWLVEAIVGLFVLLPNPQLKGKEQEVMKIAFEVLDEMLDKDLQPVEDEIEVDELEDDRYEDYINYLVEKRK